MLALAAAAVVAAGCCVVAAGVVVVVHAATPPGALMWNIPAQGLTWLRRGESRPGLLDRIVAPNVTAAATDFTWGSGTSGKTVYAVQLDRYLYKGEPLHGGQQQLERVGPLDEKIYNGSWGPFDGNRYLGYAQNDGGSDSLWLAPVNLDSRTRLFEIDVATAKLRRTVELPVDGPQCAPWGGASVLVLPGATHALCGSWVGNVTDDDSGAIALVDLQAATATTIWRCKDHAGTIPKSCDAGNGIQLLPGGGAGIRAVMSTGWTLWELDLTPALGATQKKQGNQGNQGAAAGGVDVKATMIANLATPGDINGARLLGPYDMANNKLLYANGQIYEVDMPIKDPNNATVAKSSFNIEDGSPYAPFSLMFVR